MQVVICGGGIIGMSTAYYLAKRGVKSTVIECHEPASAASGKAGGFLARDWCDSYELGPLSRKSFEMHMALSSDEHFKDVDYRRLDTLSVSIREQGGPQKQGNHPEWMDGSITGTSPIGTTETTAQVHPHKLTNAFLNAAKALASTDLKIGKVSDIKISDDKKVIGVEVDGEIIPANVIVITMGPWSNEARKWLKFPPVMGQRAHSIVIRPSGPISPHACFLEHRSKSNRCHSPEVYPRPDGMVYVCGMSDKEPLPESSKDVTVNGASCKALKDMASDLSARLKSADIITEQACYLPVTSDSLPLIGAISGVEGAYVGTGHSCWGILNAPATGEALSQLIVEGHCSLVDISPFDPARFS